jgi:hypothetical protein
MISVKESLLVGCAFREIAIRNKIALSTKVDPFEDIEEDSIDLSALEEFLEELSLEDFVEQIHV